MEIEFSKNRIVLKKQLTAFERLAFPFFSMLNNKNIKYAVVAGYLNIMFGRPRTTEDIDIISERLDKQTFTALWKQAYENYECINTNNVEDAYNNYLNNTTPIRFSKKGQFIPNIELKFAQDQLDNHTIENRIEVMLNKQRLYISPLELQIAYKLYLGTEKDIQDARFLYNLFKEKLAQKELNNWITKLGVDKKRKYLGG